MERQPAPAVIYTAIVKRRASQGTQPPEHATHTGSTNLAPTYPAPMLGYDIGTAGRHDVHDHGGWQDLGA